tara:strand:- start:16921 stop:17451 length:531 start_codon:yes stop_codon:yes gene_type:complete
MSLSLNNYTTGDVLTADQLNADNTAIKNKFDNLGVNDLAEKYVLIAYPFFFQQISSETPRFIVRINTESIITKIDFHVNDRDTGSDLLNLTVKTASSFSETAFTNATQIHSLNVTGEAVAVAGSGHTDSAVELDAGESAANLAANSFVIFNLQRTGSTSTFSNINVTLTIKTLLQA